MEWKAWRLPADAHPPAKPEEYMAEAKEFMKHLFEERGLSIQPPSKKRDTFLAHVGAKYARANGKFNEYHVRVFQAVWEKDEDIEDMAVLTKIAGEVGLEANRFKESLTNKQYREMVERDFTLASENHIWTIPSYVGENGELQVHHFRDMPSVDQLYKISGVYNK